MKKNLKSLEKEIEEKDKRIQKLECEASFSREKELERIEKERAEKLAEAGITPEDLLKSMEVEVKEEEKSEIEELVYKGLNVIHGSGLLDEKEFNDIENDFANKAIDLKKELEEKGEAIFPKDMIELIRKAEKVTGLEDDDGYEKIPRTVTVFKEKTEEAVEETEDEEDKSWFDGGVEKPWFEKA